MDLVFVRNMLSYVGKYLWQILFKSLKAWQSDRVETKKYTTFFFIFDLKCDLELQATVNVPVHDTSFGLGEHLSKILSKSLEAWESYSVDRKKDPILFI